MTQPLTRRSTLKAGAHAAWMVPAVQVVAATPAFAASGGELVDLVLDDFTASYGSDGPDLERPDQLFASFSVRNTGPDPAEDLLVSLVIPGGLYATAPSVISNPSGYTPAGVSGDLASGWTVSWVRAEPLVQGASTGSELPAFGIAFTDPLTDSPHRRWAGEAFSADLLLLPNNLNATATTDTRPVAASTPTYFTISNYSGYYEGSVLTLKGVVQNFGRQSSGDVTLKFWWNPSPAGETEWTLEPGALATAPGLTGGLRSGTGSDLDPYTYTFTHGPTAPLASYEGEPSQAEIDTTLIRFTVTIDLGEAADTDRDIYMTAGAADAVAPVQDGFGWSSGVAVPGPPPGET